MLLVGIVTVVGACDNETTTTAPIEGVRPAEAPPPALPATREMHIPPSSEGAAVGPQSPVNPQVEGSGAGSPGTQ